MENKRRLQSEDEGMNGTNQAQRKVWQSPDVQDLIITDVTQSGGPTSSYEGGVYYINSGRS